MSRAIENSATDGDLRRIRQRLRLIRRGGRTLLAVREGSRVFSLVILLAAALVLLDFVARFPAGFRWVLFATLVGGASAMFWRRFVPVTRFRPPLVDVAHRVERWLDERGGALLRRARPDGHPVGRDG